MTYYVQVTGNLISPKIWLILRFSNFEATIFIRQQKIYRVWQKLRLCDFESRPEVEAETGQAVRSHEDEASQYIDTHTIDKVSEMASDQCDHMLE